MAAKHGTARLRGLAAELKELRGSARLTTRDVAKRVGISSAIIDEAALRRTIGSVPIMAEQVRHILAMARRPNVDIRIIPFDRGAHTGLDGSYVLLEFAKARPVVYLEHKGYGCFLDEHDHVDPFHDATETLLSVALGPAESVEFLVEVVTDYVRE